MIDSSITTWPTSAGVSLTAGTPDGRSSGLPISSSAIHRAVRGNAVVNLASGCRASCFSTLR